LKITKESLNNIVLILAIITVISAFLGYVFQLGLGIPEAFYSIYGFFGGDGDIEDIQSSILLKITAFTAPLSVAMLIIFFFFQELNKWWFLTFRAQSHCIICGLGHMGMALAEDVLEKDDYTKLVIIESDESNPNIESMRLRGAIVLHGDATNAKIAKKVKAKSAKSIITLTGSDICNLEIAITLANMQANEPKLYIHLEHRENEALLQSPLFKKLNIKGFNTYDHAAQTLFMRLPLGGNVDTMGEDTVRVAIIGADSVGMSVLYRVLNLGHFYNGKPIEVTIYDEEIESKKEHFLKTYPIEFDCAYWKIVFYEESLFYAQKELAYDQIIFCKRNTQQSFADAMRLVRNKASLLGNKEVFVFADRHEMIASLVDAGKEGVFKNLFTFGEFKKICAHDVIVNEALDGMAIQTNARYNDLHGYNDKNLSPTQQWKELDPFLKDSNRMQVEHLFVKLKVINKYLEEAIPQGDFETIKQEAMQRWFVYGGTMLWDDIKGAKTLATHIPLDVLENLARTEKMRWNAFHILNGWQKLDIPNDAKEKVKKDKDKKLHPCLVPWERLDDVSKNHNHDFKSDDIETVMRTLEMAQSIAGTDGLLSGEIRRFEGLMKSYQA